MPIKSFKPTVQPSAPYKVVPFTRRNISPLQDKPPEKSNNGGSIPPINNNGDDDGSNGKYCRPLIKELFENTSVNTKGIQNPLLDGIITKLSNGNIAISEMLHRICFSNRAEKSVPRYGLTPNQRRIKYNIELRKTLYTTISDMDKIDKVYLSKILKKINDARNSCRHYLTKEQYSNLTEMQELLAPLEITYQQKLKKQHTQNLHFSVNLPDAFLRGLNEIITPTQKKQTPEEILDAILEDQRKEIEYRKMKENFKTYFPYIKYVPVMIRFLPLAL